mgnify:CR=1 FL=1
MAKKIEVKVVLDVVEEQEWTAVEAELITRAKKAAELAYAPYSEFLVGASVLLENGVIFEASNQENVSFPVGICAERALLSFVHGNQPGVRPIKLAVVARRNKSEGYAPVTPCGLCRQTINEYEQIYGHPI